ncbi:hypothetical protein [Streptomyces sennicomposti]|uniref:hypothetical protein n=1 Tax=Streptomyces sennicomposti TaxID=2873384 RepID=UPI001FFCF184|nr:hypothetical protein [Streptomyces sennicomposti]
MPNSSGGRRRAIWSSKADVDDLLRERWRSAACRTDWAHCGRQWDAVAVELQRGLEALDALRLGLRRGYPVLADYLSNRLYVMVEPGTGRVCRDVPGVRVLSTGSQVLVPVSGAGTIAAHWVSPPRASRLVDSGKLAGALLQLLDVGQAVAS